MELLGLPDLARDPELLSSATRPKHQERFADRVQEKLMGWSRLELFDALSDRDSIAGPVITVAELGSNAQLIGRDFFVDAPGSGALRFPGPPAKCSGAAWQLHRGMGAPFADADFDLKEAPLPPVDPQRCSISLGLSPAVPGMGPLSGFRGVVLTQAWAGTYATQLLGLMGADVIQLEVRATPPWNDFGPVTSTHSVAKLTLAQGAQPRRLVAWRQLHKPHAGRVS